LNLGLSEIVFFESMINRLSVDALLIHH
jgi:hypothetical protein